MKVKIKPSVFDPSPRVGYISMSSREDLDLSTCTTSIACVEQVHRAFNYLLGGTVSSCIDVNIIMNDTSSAADYASNMANSERGRVFIRTCMLAGISSFLPCRNACALQCFYTVVSAK